MIRIDSKVFVHLKSDNSGPIDSGASHERCQELILTRSRGENNSGILGNSLAVCDRSSHFKGGGTAHPGSILMNNHSKRIDLKISYRQNFG